MGPGLVSLQIVVRSVVDSADLLESAQALLPNLDIEVDLVVERTFLLVELREAERIPRDPQEIQIEALDLHEVIDVPGRESVAHEVLGGCVVGRGGVFLGGPGHADRDGRDVLEGHGVPEGRRVEENLQLRLDELPHPVRALPRTDLVPVRAPDDGEPHRESAAERLELPLEVQEHALGRLRSKVRAILSRRPDLERKHHVELAGGAQDSFAVRTSDLELLDPRIDLFRREALLLLVGRGLEKLVAAVRLPASSARDENVREVIHMAGRLECGFRKNRRSVDQVVVVAQTEEGLDPTVLPTSPKEDAIVPVVVEACEAAIQVDRGPEETAADGQGHDVLVRGHRGPEGEDR